MTAIPHRPAHTVPAPAGGSALYQRVCLELLDNPNNAAAWWELSSLVDTPQRQHDCLQRVLALDPLNERARERLERLHGQESAAAGTAEAAPAPPSRPRLGDWLVDRGMMSASQLQTALDEQRRAEEQGRPRQLGEILLANDWLTPEQLAGALVDQIAAHPERPTGDGQRLGEYLIAEGLVSQDQLRAGLAQQMRLRLLGKHVPLGELLWRSNALRYGDLLVALRRQQGETAN